MSTLQPSQRYPEAVVLRRDLRWIRQDGSPNWILHDPIRQTFYQFSESEYKAALELDGHHSLQDLAQGRESHGNCRHVAVEWLSLFVQRLENAGLLLPKSGAIEKSGIQKQAKLDVVSAAFRCVGNCLSFRIPLFYPGRWIAKFSWLAGVAFSQILFRSWLVIAALVGIAVAQAILAEPSKLTRDLLRLQGDRLIMLWGSFVLLKSFHELGHLLACSRWRVQVTECGVWFLFGTPCFYCDTSDAWKLRKKWERLAISLAGIYFELGLAVLAAIVWLGTRDGLLHSLAGSLMVVASIGTLLINANPFFKYDGYYALSDWWGVGNLDGQAQSALRWKLVRWFSHAEYGEPKLDRNEGLLASFAVIALIYRLLVLAGLAWFGWRYLVPQGWGPMVAVVSVTIAVGMANRFFNFLRSTWRMIDAQPSIRWLSVAVTGLVLIGAAYFGFAIELPAYVESRGVTEYADRLPIYASETCLLHSFSDTHEGATENIREVRLDHFEKRLEFMRAEGELAKWRCKLEKLEQSQAIDELASFSLPSVREIVRQSEDRVRELQHQLERYTVSIPEGEVFQVEPNLTTIRVHTGTSTEAYRYHDFEALVGREIERGERLGWSTDSRGWIIRAALPEEDLREVQIGASVVCRMDCWTEQSFWGKLESIGAKPLVETPEGLDQDRRFPSIRNEKGVWVPERPHYLVTIRLNSSKEISPDLLRPGGLATIGIRREPETIGERVWMQGKKLLRIW